MSTVTAAETMYSIIGRIAGLLASPGFPTADRAVLRRISPDQPLPLTFYRFAVRHLPEGWDLSTARLRDWATIVAGMAIMSPNAHRPDVGLGRALSEAGFFRSSLGAIAAKCGQHTPHAASTSCAFPGREEPTV